MHQPLIKLVESLNDKSNKNVCTYNKQLRNMQTERCKIWSQNLKSIDRGIKIQGY